MLSLKTYSAVGGFFNFVCSWGIVSFRWDSKGFLLRPVKSMPFLFVVKFYMGVFFIKAFQIGVVCFFPHEKKHRKSLDIVFLALFCGSAFASFTLYRSRGSILDCFNMFVTEFRKIKKTRLKQTRDGLDIFLETLANFMTWASAATSLSLSLLGVLEPDNPRYFYGALPESFKHEALLWILFVAEVQLMQAAVCLVFVVYLIILTYTLGIILMLKDLNLRIKSNWKLQTPWKRQARLFILVRKGIRSYNQMSIMNSWFKTTCTVLLLDNMAVFMFCHILIIYISVRLHDVLPLLVLTPFAFWAVGVVPLVVIYVFLLAQVFENSKKVIGTLKRRVLPGERRNVNLLPFGLKLAGNVKRNTPLVILMIIFRTSRSLLIMF